MCPDRPYLLRLLYYSFPMSRLLCSTPAIVSCCIFWAAHQPPPAEQHHTYLHHTPQLIVGPFQNNLAKVAIQYTKLISLSFKCTVPLGSAVDENGLLIQYNLNMLYEYFITLLLLYSKLDHGISAGIVAAL